LPCNNAYDTNKIRAIETIPSAFRCAALIPDTDRRPVAPTPLPSPEATAGALWIALDDQTARLDLANGRAADGLSILQRCEDERARAAAPAPPPPPHADFPVSGRSERPLPDCKMETGR
jgi:hypothetical protein